MLGLTHYGAAMWELVDFMRLCVMKSVDVVYVHCETT